MTDPTIIHYPVQAVVAPIGNYYDVIDKDGRLLCHNINPAIAQRITATLNFCRHKQTEDLEAIVKAEREADAAFFAYNDDMSPENLENLKRSIGELKRVKYGESSS